MTPVDTYLVAAIPEYPLGVFTAELERAGIDSRTWTFVTDPVKLQIVLAGDKVKPLTLFFPHWNWRVPDSVVREYKCVGFHLGLPHYRGGSPIQNLIRRGFVGANLVAYRMTEDVDAGPMYTADYIPLGGSLRDIFRHMASAAGRRTAELALRPDTPAVPYSRGYETFKRLTDADGRIPAHADFERFWDYVRSLDHPHYPAAWVVSRCCERCPGVRIRLRDATRTGDGKIRGTFEAEAWPGGEPTT